MLVVALLQLAVLDVLAPDLSRVAFRLTAVTVFTRTAFGYASPTSRRTIASM
jgi:hypothetical protein